MPPHSDHPANTPRVVAGRFVIERRLGRGGMGDVFLAHDRAAARPVALKLLRADYVAHLEFQRRMEREGALMSCLGHPNLCATVDVGRDGARPYIAMEYVAGETLQEQVRRGGALPPAEVLHIARQLASALEHARAKRIVHRDLTSANIVRKSDGRVTILDFGLARQEGSESATEGGEGWLAGTAEYMSPEQAMGRPVDHRSDLFSLGVVLYELLTGQVPFRSSATLDTLWKIVNDAPAPLAGEDAIARRLGPVVLRLLHKDRDQRYETAGDLGADLERLHRETGSRHSHRQRRRVPVGAMVRPLAGVAAGLALTCGGLVPGTFWLGEAAERAWRSAASERASVWVGDARGRQMTSIGPPVPGAGAVLVSNSGSVVYTVATGGIERLWTAGAGAGPQLLAEHASQPALSPDGRTIVFRSAHPLPGLYAIDVSGADRRLLHAGDVARPAFLAGGRRVIFERTAAGAPRLWTIAMTGGTPRRLSAPAVGSRPIVSPDGRLVAFESAAGVVVCSLPACGHQRVLPIGSPRAWTPDSRGLAYVGPPAGANVWVMPVAGGPGRQLTHFEARKITGIAWSPDGRWLAVARSLPLTDLPFLTPRP